MFCLRSRDGLSRVVDLGVVCLRLGFSDDTPVQGD